MNNYSIHSNLIGKIVSRAFLIVFPPTGEQSMYNIDISINLEFTDKTARTFTTAGNGWTSVIRSENVSPNFNYSDFKYRMDYWMNKIDHNPEEIIDYEVFEIKSNSIQLVGKKVSQLFLYNIKDENELNPHGFKLVFSDKSYLISTCGHDGNFIQTSDFMSDFNVLDRFQQIGNIEMIEIYPAEKDSPL